MEYPTSLQKQVKTSLASARAPFFREKTPSSVDNTQNIKHSAPGEMLGADLFEMVTESALGGLAASPRAVLVPRHPGAAQKTRSTE
jgi:hypothetical protein